MARTDRAKGASNQSAQTSFTGGEISKRVQGRIDHDLYRSSVKEALNTVIHPQGPISSRPGTEALEEVSPPTLNEADAFALFSFEGPVGDTYTLIVREAENYGSRAMMVRHIDGLSVLVHQPWSFDQGTAPSTSPPTLCDDQSHIASSVTAANPAVFTMSMPFFPSDNSYVYVRKSASYQGSSLLNDNRVKCNVIPKAGTSSTAVPNAQWRLFPLEVPVAETSDLVPDDGFSSNANGSGYGLGTYCRIVPTNGNVNGVPLAYRWLLNGYYFIDARTASSGAGRVRLRRMGILGPQAAEKGSTDAAMYNVSGGSTTDETIDYQNGDAGLLDGTSMQEHFTANTYPFFTPTNTSLNLSIQPLEESKFTATGLNTSGSSAPLQNQVEVYRASEVFIPIPIADIKSAHVAQNITSLVFAGENFSPFELFFSTYPTMCSGGQEPEVDGPAPDSNRNATSTGRYGLDLGTCGHFEYYPFLTERMTIKTYQPHLGSTGQKYSFFPVNYPHYVRSPVELVRHNGGTGDNLEFVFYVTGKDRVTGHESFGTRIDIRQDDLPGAVEASIVIKFWMQGVNQNDYSIYMYEGITGRMLYVGGTSGPGSQSYHALLQHTINDSAPWGANTLITSGSSTIQAAPERAEYAKRGPHQNVQPFAGYGNYPSAVSFSGQRLSFGGSKNSPETVWLSAIDKFTDFTATDAFDSQDRPLVDTIRDDTAIKIAGTSQSVSRVTALTAMQELVAFTRKGENRIGAGDFASLTPSTAGVYPQSGYGSSTVQPLQAEDSSLFVTQSGSSIRDIKYAADGLAGAAYGGKDLSVLARHIFDGKKVVDWTYARPPQSILYVVLDDGTIATATYNPEHEVVAWSRYTTDGRFVAITSSPDERAGSVIDVLVERAKDTDSLFMLEQFRPMAEFTDDDKHVALDSSVSSFTDSSKTEEVYLDKIHHFAASSLINNEGEIWIHLLPRTSLGRNTSSILYDGKKVQITGFTAENGGLLVPASGDTINGVYYVARIGTSYWFRVYKTYDSQRLHILPRPSSALTSQISGLDVHCYASAGELTSITAVHLAGRNDVTIVRDGVVYENQTIGADGVHTFANSATAIDVIAGLPYTSRVRTLPFVDARRGTVKGNPKRVSRVTVSLLDTRGAQVGMGDGPLVDMKDPLDEGGLSETRLRSGERNVPVRGTYDYYGEVVVSQSQPFPMTLLGIFSEMSVGDL